MKLPITVAALFLAATAALPASAATTAPHDVVRYQQDYRSHNANAYHAYAASPRAQRRAASGWGPCVRGLDSSGYSAFPSWDVCRGG